MALGEAHLAEARGGAALDLADDARHQPRLRAVAIDVLLLEVDDVDAVPTPERVVDETLAALLAVGDDVDAKVFLLAQRHHGGVILRFAQRVAFEPESRAAAVGLRQPGRARQAADAGGEERLECEGHAKSCLGNVGER